MKTCFTLPALVFFVLLVASPSIAQEQNSEPNMLPSSTLSFPQGMSIDEVIRNDPGTEFGFSMSDGSTERVTTTPSTIEGSELRALMAKAGEIVLQLFITGDAQGAMEFIAFASGDTDGLASLKENSDRIAFELLSAGEISSATVFRDMMRGQ